MFLFPCYRFSNLSNHKYDFTWIAKDGSLIHYNVNFHNDMFDDLNIFLKLKLFLKKRWRYFKTYGVLAKI